MSGKSDIDELGLWYALYRLEVGYWNDVDFNGGSTVHELYRGDGVFAVGPNRFEGQRAIKTFYEWRRSRGETTTRHIVTNVAVLAQDARRARASGLITIHRAKGGHPIQEGTQPALVADFASDCILDPDDVWRYASHVLDPVFVGADVPLSLSVDPRFLAARMNETAGNEP
jgi:hypothetical protein